MDNLYAVIKYDFVEKQSDPNAWDAFCLNIVTHCKNAGFTGVVLPPHTKVNKNDPDWQEQLQGFVNMQLQLYDLCWLHGLNIVADCGAALAVTWGRVGPDHPCHVLYTHPAVRFIKKGDESDKEEWEGKYNQRKAINEHYPNTPIYSIQLGELCGGPTTMNGSPPPTLDALPTFKKWWEAEPYVSRWVRNYPIRSRNNPHRGEVGSYDAWNPYVPKKLALPFADFCALMEKHGPWNLAMQTHGKCIDPEEDCYWRFPTETDLLQMAGLAYYHNVQNISCWCAYRTDEIGGHFLWDENWNPMVAHDGSYPLDAIQKIRELYVDEDPVSDIGSFDSGPDAI